MKNEQRDPWWRFVVGHERSEFRSDCDGGATPEISPLDYTYRKYIELDKLLSAQTPCSSVPDERAFLITHQLIEMTFKLMIFDVAVIVRTFDAIPEMQPSERLELCIDAEGFWRPAATASARLLFSAKTILPAMLSYLCPGGTGSEARFDRTAFFDFRGKLGYSSGLQSAHFRLLERAFGKSPILSLPLFAPPGSGRSACVAVTDASILGPDEHVASPDRESPLGLVSRLDIAAHKTLACYAEFDRGPGPTTPEPIGDEAVQRVLRGSGRLRGATAKGTQTAGTTKGYESEGFAESFRLAVAVENARRSTLSAACAGSRYLKVYAPKAEVTRVLQRLTDTDEWIHGRRSGSFLSTHFEIAKDLLASPGIHSSSGDPASYETGSAGGSIAYLGFVRKLLLPLFPALLAFRSSPEPTIDRRSTNKLGGWG